MKDERAILGQLIADAETKLRSGEGKMIDEVLAAAEGKLVDGRLRQLYFRQVRKLHAFKRETPTHSTSRVEGNVLVLQKRRGNMR